jgi:glutamate dehydrogenase (NAD(P)+)
MTSFFEFADHLGPAKVVHVWEPSIELRGVLVVDNVAAGPAIGGLRMAPDVSLVECARLARAMTLKNAAAGLPHGGGKSVLYGDPKMPRERKERLIRGLACALRDVREYVFGPDMGTDEACMAWVKDEIGRAIGLPREVGGIPLDEIGATGWGLSHAVEAALPYCTFGLAGARMVVQGFGAVGSHAARFLAAKGATLVAASDSQGTVYDPLGLDVEGLRALKALGKSVVDWPAGEKLDRDAVIDLECEIWIPAARPDVIDEWTAPRLRTRLVAQGANIPCTPEAEQYLHEHAVLCLPDFIANAGGVICGAMEYRGAGQAAAFEMIREKIRHNVEQVLTEAIRDGVPPRAAAMRLVTERVQRAMSYRRWRLF